MSNVRWTTYANLLGLVVILSGIIGFHMAMWGLHRQPIPPALYVPGADPRRGRELIELHGCGACHTVPGVATATGRVGPFLDRMTQQVYVGGVLPNTPDNLALWIAEPQKADPRTAMPNLGVPPADARDMAAYLYSL
jgi:cytochrome c2